jgi:hypothetical protein
MSKMTRGTELLNRLNSGDLKQATPPQVDRVRTKVCQALEELLDLGARVRPLYIGGEVKGWVRGLHLSERKQLELWYHNNYDLVVERILLATSLSRTQVESYSGVELRSLVRLINQMSESDLSLFPYLSAFVTTGLSEQMWYSRGTEISTWNNRSIEMPDGFVMRIRNAPDQARVWATLCAYREKAQTRLDGAMNALMIIRPWAGRGADPLANDLKATAKRLVPDLLEPWKEIVRFDRKRTKNDGWAHGGDDSIEGMQKELSGILSNDLHEQVVDAFYQQARERVEREQQAMDKLIASRGGKGFFDQKTSFSTADEVKQRQKGLRKGRPRMKSEDFEVQRTAAERLAKYQ